MVADARRSLADDADPVGGEAAGFDQPEVAGDDRLPVEVELGGQHVGRDRDLAAVDRDSAAADLGCRPGAEIDFGLAAPAADERPGIAVRSVGRVGRIGDRFDESRPCHGAVRRMHAKVHVGDRRKHLVDRAGPLEILRVHIFAGDRRGVLD